MKVEEEYEALYDKIIVEIIRGAMETTTKSGILLQTAPSPYAQGRVVSRGKGIHQNGIRLDMDVEVGDIILYNANMAAPMSMDSGNTKYLITERELIAVKPKIIKKGKSTDD